MKALFSPEKGTWVLLIFLAFFGVIITVNGIFLYSAISSNSGVVTQDPYRKGVAYNDTLEAAQNQIDLNDHVTFENNVLRWTLRDQNNAPIAADIVSAKIVRPIKSGDDFEVILTQISVGIYEAKLDLPHAGQWTAQMKATWNNQSYQTRHPFIAP